MLIEHFLRIGGAILGIVGGSLIFCYSQELMLRLIYLIGEEKALGADNVIRRPDGSTLLTNPSAMLHYTLPFLGGGIVLVLLGVYLLYREVKVAGTRS